MQRITPTILLAPVVLAAALIPAACSDDDAAAEGPVTKTIEVAIDGAIDDPADRVFVVTYFYSDELGPEALGEALTATFVDGGEAPASLVMGIAGMCGPEGYADAVATATGFTVEPAVEEPCTDDGAPFSASLEVPAGTTLHYSVDTGLVSDLEAVETVGGNHVGDPTDPPTAEDFEVVDEDGTTAFTYDFGTGV
jgi:hypothetical protein